MNGLFVGLNTVDIHYIINEYPEPNTKNIVGNNAVYTGGPATNAAIAFSKLGGNSTLLTSVGSHYLTQFILNELEENNVRLLDIKKKSKTNPVISSVITSDNNADRTVLTFQPSIKMTAEYNTYDLFINKHREMISTFDIMLTDGFFCEMAILAAKTAKESSVKIVIDCGSWKSGMEDLIKLADIVICSQDFYPPGTKNTDEVFDYLSAKSCEMIAITRGDKDILYREKTGQNNIPVKKVRAVDTLGAGDILHGAFCYYYIKTRKFIKALEYASEVATISCRYYGTREWARKLK
jgi:sugar/nucleoside kinase (ribokinase family)